MRQRWILKSVLALVNKRARLRTKIHLLKVIINKMVRKKSTPKRNLRNNTLQILTKRVEREERERAREEEEMNTTICLAVPRSGDLGQRRGSGGRRTHVCEVCDKELSSKQSLENHKRIHTGEKPFKCRECDKACYSAQHLTVHLRTHTGEKPFKCRECDKAFARQGDLTVHSRTHMLVTPYMCGTCNKACLTAQHLTVHLRTHTGEKPFKCDCGKAFKQSSGLLYHKRTQKH